MKSSFTIFFVCMSAGILATNDPATGHYMGKKPVESWIKGVSVKSNSDVQASECAHNTRMSNQKFAWFQIDPKKINQNRSTYGTCFATTVAPAESQLEENSGFDVFFWGGNAGEQGVGTGPIRDPNTGEPGYEDNSGAFHTGTDSTSSGNNTSYSSHPGNPGTQPGRNEKHHQGEKDHKSAKRDRKLVALQS